MSEPEKFTPPANSIVFATEPDDQTKVVLTMTGDGKLIRGPGMSDDEATVAFFKIMEETFGGYMSKALEKANKSTYVDIVFTGPPDNTPPGFVEVENTKLESIRFGEWLKRDDGWWVLRIPVKDNS